jgi:hypothetical protein
MPARHVGMGPEPAFQQVGPDIAKQRVVGVARRAACFGRQFVGKVEQWDRRVETRAEEEGNRNPPDASGRRDDTVRCDSFKMRSFPKTKETALLSG